MNVKLKSSICVTILFFFAIVSLQAQEGYLLQSDIDNFMANFEDILYDESMDNIVFAEPVTATEFMVIVEDLKEPIAKALQTYGFNDTHPIEAFYTIIMGISVLQIDSGIEILLLQEKTKKEQQILRNELLQEPDFILFTTLKKSIHPDDLSLLIVNYRFLNLLMGDMSWF